MRKSIKAISKLPESAKIDDIMYELYVIDKVNKAAKQSIVENQFLSKN